MRRPSLTYAAIAERAKATYGSCRTIANEPTRPSAAVNRPFDGTPPLWLLSTAMRRVAIGAGLILIGVAVTLFILFSQTEVARTLRQGTPISVLVVRLDEGGTEADAVSLAFLQPGGRATWISIPRDLVWPTASGWKSLHTLYASEGVAGLAHRVSLLFEVPLQYWVVVDPAGFREVVDAIGGVELMVEARLVYQDRSRNLFIDIPPGEHTFDGATALDFVRYEDGGEAGRIARHHELLRASLNRTRAAPLGRATVERIWNAVQTNLSLGEALDLARASGDLSPDRVTFTIVPTVPRPDGGGDLAPDLVRLRELVQSVVGGLSFLTRDEIRVLVLNGTGMKLLAAGTGSWLADRGFQVVGTADADRSNYPRTHLVVRDEDRPKGRALLDVLPASVQAGVQVQTDREFDLARVGGWPEGVDVILILGAGFDVHP
ncbi:MAG TPA: LytR family transcriptional regulator [Candidatus Acetothermia bacterium]|nr:LytR family transcriptional regulator [Candidatus Acetothermia bacterium]